MTLNQENHPVDSTFLIHQHLIEQTLHRLRHALKECNMVTMNTNQIYLKTAAKLQCIPTRQK